MVMISSIGFICWSCAIAAEASDDYDSVERVDVDALDAQFIKIRTMQSIGSWDEALYLILDEAHEQIDCSWIK